MSNKTMKVFTVNSKDLFNKKKNPKLSLSPTDILKNKKIKKTMLGKIVSKNIEEAKQNLKIAKDYYNRNMVFMNYQALQTAKKELRYWKDK